MWSRSRPRQVYRDESTRQSVQLGHGASHAGQQARVHGITWPQQQFGLNSVLLMRNHLSTSWHFDKSSHLVLK